MNTREVGTVLWFNSSKGFGYIKREKVGKNLFVHFKNIRGSDKGYCSLSEGDIVTFLIKCNEKNREIADDVVVFDQVEAMESRLTILLGLFKPAGVGSQLQQSFSRNSIFEPKIMPIIFDLAGISPIKGLTLK